MEDLKTFGGIEASFAGRDESAVLLLAILYDATSTWGKGADKGFEAFMEASTQMELYDIETRSEVYKKGIHVLPVLEGFHSPEEMYQTVLAKARKLVQEEKFLSFFGGEHSVSIGVMQAFQEKYKDLTIVQLDAHADLRPEYLGSAYNHACALHRASRHGDVIQLGIRSMDSSELEYLDPSRCFMAQDMAKSDAWMEDSIQLMKDKVYITLDLDVFDPSIMPATGTPEPGGMNWYMMLDYLRMIFKQKEVVGFDLVELAPVEGLHAPQFLVAKLYYKMLSYKFAYEKG